jgi:hypothetical protein
MIVRFAGFLACLAFTAEPAFAQASNPLLPRNLSPWGMFLNADIVVKAVMIGLAFASLVTAMRLGSRSGDDDLEILHEINVTPFIDVILVLLIIFMVAAPLATVDIGVNLPASTASEQPRPGVVEPHLGLDAQRAVKDARPTLAALPYMVGGEAGQAVAA